MQAVTTTIVWLWILTCKIFAFVVVVSASFCCCLVHVVHVCFVVRAIVEIHGLRIDIWLQSIKIISELYLSDLFVGRTQNR